MSYGFEARNASGRVIIDSTKPTYTQVMSGSLRANEDAGSTGIALRGELTLPNSYKNAVIAVNPPVGATYSCWVDPSAGLILYRPPESSDIAMPYRVFVEQSVQGPSSDTYGIRVFDSSGRLTFDSGHTTFNVMSNRVFRVEYRYDLPNTTVSANPDDWMLISASGIRALESVTAEIAYFLCIYLERLSNGDIQFRYGPIAFGPPPTNQGHVHGSNLAGLTRISIT